MSDNNIPTSAATTPALVTVATKAPESKGLSIYSRVVLVLLLVFVIAMTTLFTFTVQKTKAQKDIQDEIQILTKQKDALTAPAWCTQVTPDNIDKIGKLYSMHDGMSSVAQEVVKKGCKDRVDAVQLLRFGDVGNVLTVDSTHELGDVQTTLHCSADISPASDTMKTKLETSQTTDLTPKTWFDELQFVLGIPDHVVDDAATATMTEGEKVSVDFTPSFDTSWGSHYRVEVAKYFPNM